MGALIKFPKRNVQNATTEQLKKEWDAWSLVDEDWPVGVYFHYEQIHAELNRRGEGKYCAV